MQERVFRDGVLVETIEHPDPVLVPAIMSATAFNNYAAALLAGGGINGMARFMAIMSDARAAGGAAAFCAAQYDKALTFEKGEVDRFLSVLLANSIVTQGEVTALISSWPEV